MKLIIEVDKKLTCEGFERNFTEEERDILIRAIGNGTPYREQPQGEWIIRGRKLECSNCKRSEYIGTDDVGIMKEEMKLRKYCFNCGAQMKGGAE